MNRVQARVSYPTQKMISQRTIALERYENLMQVLDELAAMGKREISYGFGLFLVRDFLCCCFAVSCWTLRARFRYMPALDNATGSLLRGDHPSDSLSGPRFAEMHLRRGLAVRLWWRSAV